MIHGSLIDSIKINDISAVPKYIQLANGVIDAVKHNILRVGDSLPSIHLLSLQLHVSRDTVEKSYNILKKRDVIYSKRGKGCYIATSDIPKIQVALFFNKLSETKKLVYDSFSDELGERSEIDSFVYNSDASSLKHILDSMTKNYDYYVVFPYFKAGQEIAAEVLRSVPAEKLILVGKSVEGLRGDFAVIKENYEDDLYNALKKLLTPLSQYDTVKLIYPQHSDYPKAIIKGFYRFCQDFAFDHLLVENLSKEQIKKGTCYINLLEDDLAVLLDKIVDKGYAIGEDVGVISYNDTPLKKFILNGITTISADFELMGRYAAQVILGKSSDSQEVPFYTHVRSSV